MSINNNTKYIPNIKYIKNYIKNYIKCVKILMTNILIYCFIVV